MYCCPDSLNSKPCQGHKASQQALIPSSPKDTYRKRNKDIYTPLPPPVLIWHPAAHLPAPGMAVAFKETHFHRGHLPHVREAALPATPRNYLPSSLLNYTKGIICNVMVCLHSEYLICCSTNNLNTPNQMKCRQDLKHLRKSTHPEN